MPRSRLSIRSTTVLGVGVLLAVLSLAIVIVARSAADVRLSLAEANEVGASLHIRAVHLSKSHLLNITFSIADAGEVSGASWRLRPFGEVMLFK
jgi:hypothetical protein